MPGPSIPGTSWHFLHTLFFDSCLTQALPLHTLLPRCKGPWSIPSLRHVPSFFFLPVVLEHRQVFISSEHYMHYVRRQRLFQTRSHAVRLQGASRLSACQRRTKAMAATGLLISSAVTLGAA